MCNCVPLERKMDKGPYWLLKILLILLITVAMVPDFTSAKRSSRDHLTEYTCEDEVMRLECVNPGEHIHIIRANYGRFSVHICNPRGESWVNNQCGDPRSEWIVKQSCENRTSCELLASDKSFKDTCPETYKYLEVTFRCIPEPTEPPTTATSTTTTTTQPSTTTTITTEASTTTSRTTTVAPAPTTTVRNFCPSVNVRDIQWLETRLSNVARRECPNNHNEYAEWFCSADGVWSPERPDLSRCTSPEIQQLAKEASYATEEEAILETARGLKENVRYNTDMYGGDTVASTNALKTLVKNTRKADANLKSYANKKDFRQKMAEYVVESGSELLAERHQESWADLKEGQKRDSGTKLLSSVENAGKFLARVLKPGSATQTKTTPNILLEASVVKVEGMERIKFPSQSLYDPKVDFIEVPIEALQIGGRDGTARAVFMSVNGMNTILSPRTPVGSEPTTKLASKIVSLSLNSGEKIHNLKEPIYITLATSHSVNETNHRCVFWDGAQNGGEWSEKGCWTVAHNSTHTVCASNHLTHFAVLMDLRGIELEFGHELALSLITYIGCVISIVCLAITFFVFTCFRELQNHRTVIHANLAFCLLIAEAVFLFGIAQTQSPIVCSVVAGILHYFFLAAFSWMLLEGFQLYAMLVEVFEADDSRIRYFYIFGYGLPAVIVSISLGIDHRSYGTDSYCWLNSDNYFILSFICPVSVILAANVFFLVMAFMIIVKHNSLSYKHQGSPNKRPSSLHNFGVWVKGAFVLIVLLGLTWTFGLMFVNKETLFMAYLFTIANSLQGLFIFIFHVFLNEKVVKSFQKWSARCKWLPSSLRSSDYQYRLPPLNSGDSTGSGKAHSLIPTDPESAATESTSCLAKWFRPSRRFGTKTEDGRPNSMQSLLSKSNQNQMKFQNHNHQKVSNCLVSSFTDSSTSPTTTTDWEPVCRLEQCCNECTLRNGSDANGFLQHHSPEIRYSQSLFPHPSSAVPHHGEECCRPQPPSFPPPPLPPTPSPPGTMRSQRHHHHHPPCMYADSGFVSNMGSNQGLYYELKDDGGRLEEPLVGGVPVAITFDPKTGLIVEPIQDKQLSESKYISEKELCQEQQLRERADNHCRQDGTMNRNGCCRTLPPNCRASQYQSHQKGDQIQSLPELHGGKVYGSHGSENCQLKCPYGGHNYSGAMSDCYVDTQQKPFVKPRTTTTFRP